jgi:curved DNA-binding protein CbpA
MESDPYAVLGVAPGSDLAAVKRAFRALARRLHPDVSSDPGAKERFIEVRAAYDFLVDPERRRSHDRASAEALRADAPAPGRAAPASARGAEPLRAGGGVFGRGRFEGRVTASRRVIVDALLSRDEARFGVRVPFRFPLGPRVIDIDLALPPGLRRGDRLVYEAPIDGAVTLTLLVYVDIA